MALEKGKEIDFTVNEARQAYLVQIEGKSLINSIHLNDRDGMEIIEETLSIKAEENAHILVIEMKKEN